MFRTCAVGVCLVSVGFGACAAAFEDRCESLASWDVLDLRGDGHASTVEDLSCPPGYGPSVVHLSGTVLLAMLKGREFTDGTIVVLYRENDTRDADADGVVLFWADYGMDLAHAHNTKEGRPHVWLEQDNDSGFQYRYMAPDGGEHTMSERSGYGIVTDDWNRTNWIWQKVRIEGNHVRAKFWPAERPEPVEWAIEGTHDGVRGKRFGIKINSGDIHLAYFAAHEVDVPIAAPRAYLLFPYRQATRTDRLPLTLFINTDEESTEAYEVTVDANGKQLGKGTIETTVAAGHHAVPILLSARREDGGAGEAVVTLRREPGAGRCRVRISSAGGEGVAERTIEVMPADELEKRLEKVDEAIIDLAGRLDGLPLPPEARPALEVILGAARGHCDFASTRLEAGDLEGARDSLRFAIEALNELEGYKGSWVEGMGRRTAYDREFDQTRGVGEAERVVDVYSSNYLIRFGEPEFEAQSFVMGRTYEATIPWGVEGGSPDRDFTFEVRLVSPYGDRVVAGSNAPPDVPTSEWLPGGDRYEHRVRLDVPMEAPADLTKSPPSVPRVLDEYHRLLVTVSDPETGARLVLGNAPGVHGDRVGTAFPLGEVYISSFPMEIRGFDPDDGPALATRTERGSVVNVGDAPLEVDVLLTALAETGRIGYQEAKSVTVMPGEAEQVEFDWTPRAAGDVTLHLEVLQDGVTRTEAKSVICLAAPEGYDVRVAKRNHVERRGGRLVTLIDVRTTEDGREAAGRSASVQVLAQGRLAGSAESTESTVCVEAEPWFGYYDVLVDLGDFRYDRRLVATVVETDGMDLLVNGEPFIVKGVNVHGMDPRSPERTASMIRVMRDLGFNTWRGDYPARWQVDLAYDLNTAYTVLGPFSCTDTGAIFARQDGPHMTTARELTRLLVERYRDSAGVLMWNSCNEIGGETVDFLLTLYPVFGAHDPYDRPVHYANLYGQDFHQGQDAMGVNYYFGVGQTAKNRQPMIERSIEIARKAGIPIMYNEFNSFHGAIHSTGVEAMRDLFAWGVDQGMAGGFQYMKGNSDRHPGIFDHGFKTHKIYDDAIVEALADARVSIVEAGQEGVRLRIANRRRCTFRQVKLALTVSGTPLKRLQLADLPPETSIDVDVVVPESAPGPTCVVEGSLTFETHFGFQCRVPVRVYAPLP